MLLAALLFLRLLEVVTASRSSDKALETRSYPQSCLQGLYTSPLPDKFGQLEGALQALNAVPAIPLSVLQADPESCLADEDDQRLLATIQEILFKMHQNELVEQHLLADLQKGIRLYCDSISVGDYLASLIAILQQLLPKDSEFTQLITFVFYRKQLDSSNKQQRATQLELADIVELGVTKKQSTLLDELDSLTSKHPAGTAGMFEQEGFVHFPPVLFISVPRLGSRTLTLAEHLSLEKFGNPSLMDGAIVPSEVAALLMDDSGSALPRYQLLAVTMQTNAPAASNTTYIHTRSSWKMVGAGKISDVSASKVYKTAKLARDLVLIYVHNSFSSSLLAAWPESSIHPAVKMRLASAGTLTVSSNKHLQGSTGGHYVNVYPEDYVGFRFASDADDSVLSPPQPDSNDRPTPTANPLSIQSPPDSSAMGSARTGGIVTALLVFSSLILIQ